MDSLSHGSRRSWIRVGTEILGLEQEGNTEMEDEHNTTEDDTRGK